MSKEKIFSKRFLMMIVGILFISICVGYGADFLCWIVQDVFSIEMTLLLRIFVLVLGSLFAGLGVAFYMVAEMGVAPYDSVALIIEKLTKKALFDISIHVSFIT